MRRVASVLVLALMLSGCSSAYLAKQNALRAATAAEQATQSETPDERTRLLIVALEQIEMAIKLVPTVSLNYCLESVLLQELRSEWPRPPSEDDINRARHVTFGRVQGRLRLLYDVKNFLKKNPLDYSNRGIQIDGNLMCYANRAEIYRLMRPLTDANLQQSAADVQRVLSANLPLDHPAPMMAKSTQQLLPTERERGAQWQAEFAATQARIAATIAAKACELARGVQVLAQLSQEMSVTYSGCIGNILVQSVKLPLSISEELTTQAHRRGLKVGFDMSLPFFQSLIDSRDSFLAPDLRSATRGSTAFRSGGGVRGHAQTDYTLGFTGGESCVVQATGGEDDHRVAIPICAVLVHINRLLRTSRFDELQPLLARYLDQVPGARTGLAAPQPASARTTGPK